MTDLVERRRTAGRLATAGAVDWSLACGSDEPTALDRSDGLLEPDDLCADQPLLDNPT